MLLVLNGPEWFRGIESIFIFVAGLITILIAILSYKAYSITKVQKYKYFGASFLLMGVSFFILSLFSSLLILHVSAALSTALSQFDLAFFFHMLLTLVAYMILLIITLKVKDTKVTTLLMALVLIFVLFSYQHFLKFHIVSFILLFFLSYQFYTNYLEKKNPNAKCVFASFYLLTCAEAFFIIMIYSNSILYVVARVLQFIGYLTLFYAFLQITQNGGKKRKT